MSDNLSALSWRKGLENSMFEQLVEEARANGGAPDPKALNRIAKEFLVGDAITYGTASFYDFLKPENQGKKVHVCTGSACMLAGTQDGVKAELGKHFKAEEIGEMCCLGRCHENAAFAINDTNYSAKSPEDIAAIVSGTEVEAEDNYRVGHNLAEPVLTAEFPGLDEYYSLWKDVLKRDSAEVLEEIKTSGIRGRGGAGFPMGIKWESCRNTEDEQKFIVCNADEGDPGAYSDRYLMEKQPHAVLFGMMVGGYCVGSNRGVLYIRKEYPESITIIRDAVALLDELGLTGENILGSGFDFRFKVVEAAGAYICGEETALLASIEGQRPEVRIRPPYPTQKGLFNKPTVVNNVETLAGVHYILKHGGEKYASLGRGRSTGTKLVCLDSFFNTPGMVEVEMGTPFSWVVNDFGGGFKEPVKAVHVGGPLGGIVPIHKINDLTIDFESFQNEGFLLGHAGVISVPETYPMVTYLEHLFQFTAHESCGKCFPCRLGATRGEEMLRKAQEGSYKIDRELMDDLLETMEKGSLCALGGGLPLGIKNALQYFDEELKGFFSEK
jgi:NADH:ubiquinone oxidoreductase subunit F (NADH-binding)/NADH:ubiquinone oxidoreductase subunit E